jgi:hypothetical protein
MKIIFPLTTVLTGGQYRDFLLDLLIYPSTEQNIVNQDAKELIISDYHFFVHTQLMMNTNPIVKLKEIADVITGSTMSVYPTIKEIHLWVKADIGILDTEYSNGVTWRQHSESDYPNAPFATNGSQCIIRLPNWENTDIDLFLELYNKQGGQHNMELITLTQMQSITAQWNNNVI